MEIKIHMGTNHHIETRKRYNYWDLLADVGGFHDGIILLCSIFMGSISSVAFKTDYLAKKVVDKEKNHGEQTKVR